jgi:nucleotide-binding universal stress UspA family protein
MLQNILLVTDGSAPAKRAADFAATLATRFGSTIIVLHAYDRVPSYLGQPYYNEALAGVLQAAHALTDDVVEHLYEVGVADVVKDVLEGPAADAILRAAEARKPDLIVIGARGSGTWQGLLLGSVSMAVTQRAECPVLVVK